MSWKTAVSWYALAGVVGTHTLDNSVGRKLLDETPLLISVEVEMKGIYDRQKV